MPSGLPPAADCWPHVSAAVALETSITATAAIAVATADSIVTAAADAAAVNAANAAVAAPLAAVAGYNDYDAITTLKQASVISSTAKISLDERQRDNQPDERHKRGR